MNKRLKWHVCSANVAVLLGFMVLSVRSVEELGFSGLNRGKEQSEGYATCALRMVSAIVHAFSLSSDWHEGEELDFSGQISPQDFHSDLTLFMSKNQIARIGDYWLSQCLRLLDSCSPLSPLLVAKVLCGPACRCPDAKLKLRQCL